MPKLSKRIMSDVGSVFHKAHGIRPCFVDINGTLIGGECRLFGLDQFRRKLNTALQESINLGEAASFVPAPALQLWVLALEDRRAIHGGLLAGPVRLESASRHRPAGGEGGLDAVRCELQARGMTEAETAMLARALEVWPDERALAAGLALRETFYQVSGWRPELMEENRLRCQQQEQINRAIADQRRQGQNALYAFEKERFLLASIRSGDRRGARSILNEMLATIYMSSPKLLVLRARAIELMTCLTRAAIEDSPLLEPLIERNHAWTERLVNAQGFEDLSRVLMDALDEFIDGIYLHGMNRSNLKVRQAMEYISLNYMHAISLEAVAAHVGLSRFRVAHLVKQFTGRTITQLVHQVRVTHAQHLLTRSDKNCAEIASETGFTDQSYFIKQFRRATGLTPARYRRVMPDGQV